MPPSPPEPRIWAAIARFVLSVRGLALVFALLVAGGVASLPRLTFDFSPQTLFDSTSEKAAVHRFYRELYGADDHVLLVLVEADLTRADTWRLLADVEQGVSDRVPAVETIRSIASQEVPVPIEDGVAITPLPGPDDALPRSDAEAAALAEQARANPLLRNTLISPSGEVAAVYLKVADDVAKVAVVRPVINELRQILEETAEAYPGVRLHLLGPHAYRTTVVSIMISEELRFAPLTALVLSLILGLLFRSLQGVAIPLLSVGLGALWTVALMALTNEPVNIINTITATLILVIGVADAIHMMERYGQERSRGQDRREAVRSAVVWVGGACLLTSLTTAVGFATLSTAHLGILRRFGIYAALGVMITFVTTLVFVPWALDRFAMSGRDRRGEPRQDLRWDRFTDALLSRQARLVRAHPRVVAVAGFGITGLFAAGILNLTVDNFIMEYVPKGDPIRAGHEVLEKELAGVVYFDMVLEIDDGPDSPWYEPELLRRAALAEAAVLAHPEINSAESILGLLRELRYVQRGGAAAGVDRLALPDSRREVASLLLLAEMGGQESLAVTHLGVDARRMRITFRAGDLGARNYLTLEGRVQEAITSAFEGAPRPVRGVITGTSQVGYSGIDSLIRDLLRSLGWAFVVIFVTLALLFRSWRIALLAMGPNLMPIVVVLGAMGWASRHLETLSAMVFSIGLGIAVDDTIHYLARYCQEVRAGLTPDEAVQRTTEQTGRAIITTSLVLLFGFGVLFTSAFPPNQSFAVLAGAVIFVALLADLWVLPALLLWFRPHVPGASAPATEG